MSISATILPVSTVLLLLVSVALTAPTTSTDHCKGATQLKHGYILVGFSQAVLHKVTVDECVAACASHDNKFRCLSGMFYYSADDMNCILNSEDQSTKPDFLSLERDEDVVYFEPKCVAPAHRYRRSPTTNRNVLQLNTDDFGHWTVCDNSQNVHKRFKQCQTYNPNKCKKDSTPCDPKKEPEYDTEVGTSSSAPETTTATTETTTTATTTTEATTTESTTTEMTTTEPDYTTESYDDQTTPDYGEEEPSDDQEEPSDDGEQPPDDGDYNFGQ